LNYAANGYKIFKAGGGKEGMIAVANHQNLNNSGPCTT
jgi:hypothetical protein